MNEEQTAPKKKKQRIGAVEIPVLLFFAVIFDILSLIPYVNVGVVIVSQSLIALFFYIHGVNVLSKKRALPYIIAWISEAIPIISMFPAITLETIIIIALTRIEDRTGIDPTGPKIAGVKKP